MEMMFILNIPMVTNSKESSVIIRSIMEHILSQKMDHTLLVHTKTGNPMAAHGITRMAK